MASDGHSRRIWTLALGFVGMQLGGAAAVSLQLWQWAAGVPGVGFGAALLGALVGASLSRSLARNVLHEGVQVRGEVTKVEGGGSKATIAYSYEVARRVSSHNMWCKDPEMIANTKRGTPILVIYDRGRINRHLAYLPAQFGKLRELLPGKLGEEATGEAPAVVAEAEEAPKQVALGQGVLPPPPRPLPIETARAIPLGTTPRQNGIVITMGLVTFATFMLMHLEVIAPTIWVATPLFATAGLALAFTLSSPFTGRWLLCNGVEAAGKVDGVWPPNKGSIRIDYSFEAGGRRHRHALCDRDLDRAAKVQTNDPVLVLYARGAPWFSTAYIEPEVRALIEECKRRP